MQVLDIKDLKEKTVFCVDKDSLDDNSVYVTILDGISYYFKKLPNKSTLYDYLICYGYYVRHYINKYSENRNVIIGKELIEELDPVVLEQLELQNTWE